jgi:general stress protein CsbA
MILGIGWITFLKVILVTLIGLTAIVTAANVYAEYKHNDWNNAMDSVAIGFCLQSGFATLGCLLTAEWGVALAGGVVCIATGLVVRLNLFGATRYENY